jgi:multidrug efflux pump subunit AcrA (membrane-fusion protein)
VFALETIDKMASSNNEAAKRFNQRNISFGTDLLGPEGNSGKTDANQGIVQGPIENLRNLGMSDEQIVHIASTREVTRTIDVSSPINGYLLTRSITKGQRFMEGTEFFQIADLSTVWVNAEVLDSDTQVLQPGAKVKVRTADGKHQATAVVSNALPVTDPSTRTSKIRQRRWCLHTRCSRRCHSKRWTSAWFVHSCGCPHRHW